MKPTNQLQPWEQSLSDFPLPTSHFEASRSSASRRAFTLVELLVVIAIIGLLAALLVAAVGPAITRANQARITAEITQIDTAIKDYKTAVGSFPPNAQVDGTSGTAPLAEATIKSEFQRHFLKAFPNHREPDAVIAGLVGLAPNGAVPASNPNDAVLDGGMTAAEALVFWIGGFSSEPEYPISGAGGPSYVIDGPNPNQQDPIENRGWRLGVKIENLGPRDEDAGQEDYFPDDYDRFITYTDPRSQPNNLVQRRINFWYLNAPGTKTPYLYLDASRGSGVTAANDTPAASPLATKVRFFDELTKVHALKTRNIDASAALPYVYANNKSFQILHPGVDDTWIETPRIDPTDNTNKTLIPQELLFPDGPWVEELADTLTNFTESTLEDAQP